MKRFVVSYIDWFNNELYSHIINADDELQAIKTIAVEQYGFDSASVDSIENIEDFKGFCFDCDCMMNVIEV